MIDHRFDHQAWDATLDKMLNSPVLRDYLLLGHHADYGFPVLAPRRRRCPHTWVMGMPGSGKTALYAGPILTQLIAGGDRSVLALDAKPSKDLFLNGKIEGARAGLPFRSVDLTPGRQTHVFNPCTQSHLARQNLSQKIETQMQAIAMEFGPGYGRRWFSSTSETAAAAAAAKYPCRSFLEMARLLMDPAAFNFIDREVWRAAAQWRIEIDKLAAFPALNQAEDTPGVSPEVLAHAVDLRQLFHQPQILYFALNSAENRTLSRDVAGLAAYHTFAAGAREENKRCEVELFIDEGQEFVGPGLSIVLDQARSMGIAVTLLHQHPGQLVRDEVDYSETLECATGLHVVFNPVGQKLRKWIMDTGGTCTRPAVSWSQSLSGHESADRDFRLRHADSARPDELPRASVNEMEVRRISENDLIRWSANPRIALVRLVADEGLARYGGAWMPVVMTPHVSADEYRARLDAPWPLGEPGTIVSPLESDFDRRFRDDPQQSAARQRFQERVRNLGQRKKN